MVSAVPVTVGVTVETWLSGFLLTEDYSKEQALKEEVSRRSMYSGSKDETFNELEPNLDRGDGIGGAGDSGSNGGNMVIWVSSYRRL
ncbi:hypothetical protein DY000_02060950 [Brassica cretica]|uniref:Uncharacterized protein n=1 Tax=Brassica cretica TaxID=69181 RepID=A0ABQ7AZA5_BRACR|nr:hypothetical protein DY000_02060950 [Brassica cretica]